MVNSKFVAVTHSATKRDVEPKDIPQVIPNEAGPRPPLQVVSEATKEVNPPKPQDQEYLRLPSEEDDQPVAMVQILPQDTIDIDSKPTANKTIDPTNENQPQGGVITEKPTIKPNVEPPVIKPKPTMGKSCSPIVF